MTQKRIVLAPDGEALAGVVARRFLRKLRSLSRKQEVVHIALTGGTIGIRSLAVAGDLAADYEIDWQRVHFWWGDERFVTSSDGDRNALQAREAFLARVPVAEANIHEMGASDAFATAEDASDAYAAELSRFASEDVAWPHFDICFLGVGPDGHIASLFPDRGEIHLVDVPTAPVHNSPKPPAERVTLTRPVINGADRVWLVLAGAEKASTLGLVLAGASYSSVPAAGAKGRKKTILFVDDAAAVDVPEDLIDPQ